MSNIRDFISFIKTDEMQVIERDSNHVVIRQYDVCMEYSPCSGTGQFSMAAGDINIYDYGDYLEQNIKDFEEFKADFLEHEKNCVIQMIKKNAPYTGQSALLASHR